MARRAHRQRDRRGVANIDPLLARGDGERAAGREIMAGIAGIRLLDIEILDVAAGGGEAPGDVIVMAENEERRARRGDAGEFLARRLDAREIPHPRRGEIEMRVVGEQRLAGLRVRAAEHPVVRRCLRSRHRRQKRVKPVERQLAQCRAGVAQHHRRVLGIGGEQHREVGRRDPLQQPRPQHLAAVIAGELDVHDLAPYQRIRRPPRLGREVEDIIFRRQRAAPRGEEGIDAGRIGVERRAHLGREDGKLRLGRAIEAEHPHRAIDPQGARAEDFREPPGAIAPHHVHLEQAVLGMDEAEREIGVVLVLRGDRRNAVGVAADLHRRVETWQRQRAIRDGQRRAEKEQREAPPATATTISVNRRRAIRRRTCCTPYPRPPLKGGGGFCG